MPVEVKIPSVGESIAEVVIGNWRKSIGEPVRQDEEIVELETDKATFDLPSPASGVITKILKKAGETASIGEVIGYLGEGPAPQDSTTERAASSEKKMGSAAAAAAAKPARATESRPAPAEPQPAKTAAPPTAQPPPTDGKRKEAPAAPEPVVSAPRSEKGPSQTAAREEQVVPMTPIRRRIAERLVEAQRNAALLTTFNEVDMSAVIAIRKRYQESFQKQYGVKLGFMSFFVKAVVAGLSEVPQVNSEVRGTDVVFRNYFDIGIAVGGGKGLVVPILRNAETMSFAEIERAIADFARRAEQNRIKVDELQGGTFTISNGGIYGSLMSTPIVNPPQSGVLGMHAIEERPVVRDGQIVIRPMMYVALTYDHRVIDGREAVTFLKRIKEIVEDPSRLLIEI
jgi:2-oxoglutarate dehydrogenase E2 component (dihydrolipoamide succinyltransferase)